MLKRALPSLSLVSQIALLMLLLGLLGIGGMGMAAWMAESIEGNAHAINKAGSLRMQSYRLLSAVPLSGKKSMRIFARWRWTRTAPIYCRRWNAKICNRNLLALRHYWQTTLQATGAAGATSGQVTSPPMWRCLSASSTCWWPRSSIKPNTI